MPPMRPQHRPASPKRRPAHVVQLRNSVAASLRAQTSRRLLLIHLSALPHGPQKYLSRHSDYAHRQPTVRVLSVPLSSPPAGGPLVPTPGRTDSAPRHFADRVAWRLAVPSLRPRFFLHAASPFRAQGGREQSPETATRPFATAQFPLTPRGPN